MKQHGKHLDKYRAKHPAMGSSPPGSLFGYFRAKSPDGSNLEIISSGERTNQKVRQEPIATMF